uniref:Transmembrane protein n=1 Tax=Parastrongyloides trichosuri TaxID=131310 RepID=A0A0N4ZUZ4_PARTI
MVDNEIFKDILQGGKVENAALKFAFYNTLLFILTGLCILTILGVYKVIESFIMPSVLALMFGVILFPFKRSIHTNITQWLTKLDNIDRPLIIGLLLIPLEWLDKFSCFIYNNIFVSKNKYYIIGGYGILKVLTYERSFLTLLTWIEKIYWFVSFVIDLFSTSYIFTLMVAYGIAYGCWIYAHDEGQLNKKFARTLSLPLWLTLISSFSQFFTFLKVIVFIGIIIVLGLISLGLIAPDIDGDEEDDVKNETIKNDDEMINDNESLNSVSMAFSSDFYITTIFGLCVLEWIAKRDYILFIIIASFLYAVFKEFCIKIGIIETFKSFVISFWSKIEEVVKRIVTITCPGSLRKFVKLMFTSDKIFLKGFKSSTQLISSIGAIMFLLVGGFCILFFTAFQIHSETVQIIKLGSNIISSQPDLLENAINYTGLDVDTYIDDIYKNGRNLIATNIRKLADTKDESKGDELELRVKEFLDNMYRKYEEGIEEDRLKNVTDKSIKEQIMGLTDLTKFKSELTNIVKENVDTIISVAKSAWSIVLLNISVLINIFGSILIFGVDVMNFILSLIIFFTMLYYLLSESYDKFVPMHILSEVTSNFNLSKDKKSLDISIAFENAISSVFVLSLKKATFYALYTYFINTLFDLKIIIIPTISSAIFAAVPIVPPYTLSIIGAIEIFFIRDETTFAGILYVLLSLFPTIFIENEFYKEVKGTHPYMTVLSVIGGYYWLGVIGIIFGPVILCSLITLFNIYISFSKNEKI